MADFMAASEDNAHSSVAASPVDTTHEDLEFKTGMDAATLLAPFTSEMPTGVDVRQDEKWVTHYYQLRDTRNQLRRHEREAPANGELLVIPNTSWQPVISQATTLLTEGTKDIEIASWLTEGLTRSYGFAGLHDGLLLLEQLITRYEKNLFPVASTEENDDRFAALLSLSGVYHEGTLIYPLNLSAFIFTSEGSISYWDYVQAQSPEEKNKLTALIHQMRHMDTSKNDAVQKILENSLNYIDQIETFVKSHFSVDEFNLMGIRQKVKQCLEARQHLLNLASRNQTPSPQQTDDGMEMENDWDDSTENNTTVALNYIEKAYEIFHLEQPHSPITSSLARILRWADQDLDELVNEIIPDSRARQLFCLITGATASSPKQIKSNKIAKNFDEDDDEDDSNNF